MVKLEKGFQGSTPFYAFFVCLVDAFVSTALKIRVKINGGSF